MSELDLDAVTKEIVRLLESIPAEKYSLEERRHAFRRVVYKGAMKILEDFPVIIVGPPPGRPRAEEEQLPTNENAAFFGGPRHPRTDGERPPYHPSGINWLLCQSLGTCPQQTS
jgi:hypothetical protein